MTPKLSLCVITGNAEKYISRFLECFKPLADEIVIVRACGNQPPDETLSIARRAGCVTGIYSNRIDWPHVDDFAAARNLAFSMASHDFVMWADMDDVISSESIASIRDAISRMPEDCAGIEIPYEVPEDGVTVFRERIIRRGAAEWTSPIHEHLVFPDGAKLARITNAKVLHQASGSRAPNDERNLRILESIPRDQLTTSHRFHLFQSLRAVGRVDEAVAEAVDMLANPPADMGSAEKYELFIAVGQVSPDVATRSNMILQSLGLDPTRREAFGEMAICMISMGKPKEALGFTTAMRAISPPRERSWNARAKYYGWLGEHLHGMALRANGRIEEADAIETNHFIRSGAKISLIHATRGRARQAAHCRRTWLEDAIDPDGIEHIFALDVDDPDALLLTVHNHVLLRGNGGPVAAWNAAAEKSRGQILVQLSDDWQPFYGWDKAIIEAIGDTSKPAVLAVSDGHRTDDLLCMAICTRARFLQQGNLFHPEFFSMFSDNWFSHQAFADGVVIDVRDRLTFEHRHPAFGKAEMDSIYARSNDAYHYQTGEKIMRRLDAGILTSADIHGWFDFRDLYDEFAKSLPDQAMFAEVGCWKGKSIIYLAQRCADLGKDVSFIAVDTFEGDSATGLADVYAEFAANLKSAECDHEISPVIMESTAAAEKFGDYFDAVFIDAAHDEASVTADIAAWLPKVKSGGILAGHDADAPGVIAALATHKLETQRMGRCWLYLKP